MKKRIIALTLAVLVALSSTSAFAATTNCTSVNYKYNLNDLLKNVKKVTINGKVVDLKTVDLQALLKQYAPAEKPAAQTQKPAVQTQKPAAPAQKPAAPVEKPATPVEKPAATTQNNTTLPSSNLTYEQKVVELVNIERQKAGLPALKLDAAISNVARTKSKDMATNNYFAHQSPTYGSAGDMLRQFGISWRAWGENIAARQATPEIVVNAWMNSSGHRANILSPNFNKIGVGYATNASGRPYWTQIFTD